MSQRDSDPPEAPELPAAAASTCSAQSDDRCANCAAVLQGAFCHVCGQEDRGTRVPLRELLMDGLGGLFSFDSKLHRTLGPLLLRPGAVTVDVLAGRRARYVPPLRLYLFVSFVFFLALQLLSPDLVRVRDTSTDGKGGRVIVGGGGTPATVEDDPRPDGVSATSAVPASAEEPPGAADPRATSPAATGPPAAPTPESVDDGTDERSLLARAIVPILADPERGTQLMLERLPVIGFLLVPLFALWLLVLFRGSERFYLPHLVASLHLHTVALSLFTLGNLTELLPGPDVLGFLAVAWLPVNTFISLRRIHGRSRWATLWRGALLGFVHLLAVSGALLASMLLAGLSMGG